MNLLITVIEGESIGTLKVSIQKKKEKNFSLKIAGKSEIRNMLDQLCNLQVILISRDDHNDDLTFYF